MPRVDFYLLADASSHTRLMFTCRLIEKAYHVGHHIYIHLPSQQVLQQLDDLLWTYRDDSFLPHHRTDESLTVMPPIQLGCGVEPQDHKDILINLVQEIPVFYARFQRVIEVILQDPLQKEQARHRYRLYREQGCQLESHRL